MRPGSAVRKAAKAAVLPAGAVSRRRTGDLVILLYHRVGAGEGEITLSPQAFARQLAHLAEHERVLSLDVALRGDPGGGVVVSFDDGYRDFAEQVVPLLDRYRIPAVLYLTTGLVAGEEGHGGSEALTWPQLGDAVASGLVTVGAHTHTHADLSRASEHDAERELRRSKELIEDRLGVPCRHFAYPWADRLRSGRLGGPPPLRLGGLGRLEDQPPGPHRPLPARAHPGASQ